MPGTVTYLQMRPHFRSLKVWDVKLLKQGKVPPVGGMHFNTCTAFESKKYVVASHGWRKNCSIIAEDANLGTSASHHGFIKKAEFSPDGTKLVTLDTGHSGGYETGSEQNAAVKIISLPNCQTISNGLRISSPTAFSVGSKFIAAGSSSGNVSIFDLETLDCVANWQTGEKVTNMAYSRTHGHLVTCSGRKATVWNTRYEAMKEMDEFGDSILVCVISHDGKYLAIGLDSGEVLIWKLSDDSVDHLTTLTTHTAYIKDIEFNESGTRMLTTGDLSLRIWDVEANFKMISVYYAPVNNACFLGDVVLAGEATGNLKYLSL